MVPRQYACTKNFKKVRTQTPTNWNNAVNGPTEVRMERAVPEEKIVEGATYIFLQRIDDDQSIVIMAPVTNSDPFLFLFHFLVFVNGKRAAKGQTCISCKSVMSLRKYQCLYFY